MFKRETKVSVGFRPRRRLLSTPSFSSRACTRLSRLLTCDSDCESCCSTIVTTEALSPDQEYPARFPTTTEPIPARSHKSARFYGILTHGMMAKSCTLRSVLRQCAGRVQLRTSRDAPLTARVSFEAKSTKIEMISCGFGNLWGSSSG
jgi:hypothetical protein